jgi:YidC/Oxa1 family membrane protein insertase
LNILPIVMSVSMIWQQKLMPTTGDPRQAKMMQFMPVIMLFVFYGFASGLVLYWTTNQFLMIIQQLLYQRRKARKAAEAAA